MTKVALPRRSPLKFFVLVFLLSVPFMLVGALAEQGLPLNLPLSALMFPCPLIAAVILIFREEGAQGVRGSLKRIFDYRRIRSKIWYVPMIFLIPFLYLLSYGMISLMGAPLPIPGDLVLMIPILFLVFFITAMCEEVGWTGYAIDPMQGRWGALGAGLVLGLIWSMWHVIPDIQAHQTWTFIAGQRLYSIFLRVLIVWVYNNTSKSLFAAIILHDMDNVSVYSLFPDGDLYNPAITAAITAIAVVIVAALWGPRTLARYRFGRAMEERA